MSITTQAQFDKAGFVKQFLPTLQVCFMESGYNPNRDEKRRKARYDTRTG
jgi:hypothetical protein